MRNAGLDESQAGIKISRSNINKLRYADDTTLEEINPEYSLEGLMLNLKLQYFGHLIWKANSLEKTLMLKRLKAKGKWEAEEEMVR